MKHRLTLRVSRGFVDIITHHSVPKGPWGPFDIYTTRTRIPVKQVLSGAAAFLNDRAHRFTTVHTDYLDDEGKPGEAIRPSSERTDECSTTDQVHRTPMHHTANTRPRSTPYWRESDFVAGHVSSKHANWESKIIQDHRVEIPC